MVAPVSNLIREEARADPLHGSAVAGVKGVARRLAGAPIARYSPAPAWRTPYLPCGPTIAGEGGTGGRAGQGAAPASSSGRSEREGRRRSSPGSPDKSVEIERKVLGVQTQTREERRGHSLSDSAPEEDAGCAF